MKAAGALVALLFLAPAAHAADGPACAFVPRADRREMLQHMPTAVVGYADCASSHPELRGLMMARFKTLDQSGLESFLDAYARVAVADGRRSYVVKQMVDAGGRRQAVFETLRPGGSAPVWHYAFTSRAKNGDVVLYVHTSGAKESRDLRSSLQAVRHELGKSIL